MEDAKKDKLKYQREYYYKNFDTISLKTKERFKKWYIQNKDKQRVNAKKDYILNKSKWKEREWTRRHKEDLLKFLSSNCALCSKEGIKSFHHKEYGQYKNFLVKSFDVDKEKNFKEYSSFLLGFCSLKCHRRYEKLNNKSFH